MFENLSERLSGVFDRLTKQGALSEEDVKTALREVRVALLEADVSLPVAREFVKKVQNQANDEQMENPSLAANTLQPEPDSADDIKGQIFLWVQILE